MFRLASVGGFLAAGAVLAAPQVHAQKSKDTLRYAMGTQLSVISMYEAPHPDASMFLKEIYDPLVRFDERKKVFVPWLAKSWKRGDGGTIDFELRDDVKFHNGKPLDADDVVYTAKWLIDPKTKIMFKNRYTAWIKDAEKIGPHTVRLHTIKPTAIDLMRLSISFFPYDSTVHQKLENKGQYGANPIGTGALKIVSFDAGRQFTFVRNPEYNVGPKSPVGRLVGLTIADRQTQLAEIMVGSLDVLSSATPDQVKSVADRKDLRTTTVPSLVTTYMLFDVNNRSGGAKPLTDVRVRRAMLMAVDRAAIAKNFGVRGESTRIPNAFCLPEWIACDVKSPAPRYDPAAAKRLLAEAGYGDGFDIELVTIPLGAEVATAVSGYLQAVGIRARINQVTVPVQNSMLPTGKIPVRIGTLPGNSLPDAHLIWQLFLEAGRVDYIGDEQLRKLGEEALFTLEGAKRTTLYAQLFDRFNEQAYGMHILPLDTAYIHSREVDYVQDPMNANTPRLGEFRWAK